MMSDATSPACPETLRSAGVAPKPAPVRRLAHATFDRVGAGRAIVEVTYVGAPELFSMCRVEIRNPKIDANGIDHLYEAAHNAARVAASVHGYELDRFSRA